MERLKEELFRAALADEEEYKMVKDWITYSAMSALLCVIENAELEDEYNAWKKEQIEKATMRKKEMERVAIAWYKATASTVA